VVAEDCTLTVWPREENVRDKQVPGQTREEMSSMTGPVHGMKVNLNFSRDPETDEDKVREYGTPSQTVPGLCEEEHLTRLSIGPRHDQNCWLHCFYRAVAQEHNRGLQDQTGLLLSPDSGQTCPSIRLPVSLRVKVAVTGPPKQGLS